MDGSLYGPEDSWRNVAQSSLYMHNIDSVDCYYAYTESSIIGITDSQITFYAQYDLWQFYIKDLIPDEMLLVEPYKAITEDGRDAYIWALNNGYCMIVAYSTDAASWHNQRIRCLIHAVSLEYFSPISTPD